jgi:tetratricopeptide (TPR) repeat protein
MRSQLPKLLALVLGLGLLCSALDSHADQAGVEAAKKHNTTAKRLFSLGLFAEAAAEYLAAYKANPAPAFLFNLAQCYKRMGSPENMRKAIFYYRSFLHNAPDTPLRGFVEEQIARLERALRAEMRPPSRRPIYKRWWFWTALGVAAAGAVVGTALALRPDDQEWVAGNLIDRRGVPW